MIIINYSWKDNDNYQFLKVFPKGIKKTFLKIDSL